MPTGSKDKDYTQGIKESYDPALERLRVDALINDGVDALVINSDGSINVNVSGGGSLPAGAATAAKQDTGNASLASIDTKLTSPLTVVSSGSSTVSGTVTSNEAALTAFQTSQYTIGTSAVQITPTPLSGRKSISLRASCTGSNAIYIGPSSGVTTGTGWVMYNGDTLQMDLDASHTVYAISNAAAQTIFAMEIS